MATVRVRRVRMRERPERTRWERLLMRRPEVVCTIGDVALRIPLVRTAVLRDIVDRSYAALRREDFEMVAQLFYRPDAVLNFGDDVGVDYDRRYEGRELAFATYARWLGEWGQMEREPVGFVDRGDTFVILARERVRGELSGLEVERELGQVFHLRGAGVAEQWEYRSWAEALDHRH